MCNQRAPTAVPQAEGYRELTATVRTKAVVILLLLGLPAHFTRAVSLGTAISYQGRLSSGANAADGLYDLQFTLYDSLTEGIALAGPLTNADLTINNGLFTVSLDLGTNVFTGSACWLEIAVRTNGAAQWTQLSPRQPIQPVPYALTAATVLPSGLPAGGYSGGGLTLTSNLTVAGTVTIGTGITAGGGFTGNGAGLTNVAVAINNLTQTYAAANTNEIWISGPVGAFTLGRYAWSAGTRSYTNGVDDVALYFDPDPLGQALNGATWYCTNAAHNLVRSDLQNWDYVASSTDPPGGAYRAADGFVPALWSDDWGLANGYHLGAFGTNLLTKTSPLFLLNGALTNNAVDLTNINGAAIQAGTVSSAAILQPLTLTNLVVTNASPVTTGWNCQPDLTLYGNLSVFPLANVFGNHSGRDPMGGFFNAYWPEGADGGSPNMALYFMPRSEYQNGQYQTYHDSYILAGSWRSEPTERNVNFNVSRGGWLELDQGDDATVIVHANGGVSIDQPGTWNHPNWFLDWNLRGPGTNSFSVRSNIISRYGNLISTNGGAWLGSFSKEAGHALTNGLDNPVGFMFFQNDGDNPGLRVWNGSHWTRFSEFTDD